MSKEAVEAILSQKHAEIRERALAAWKGREREAVIEIVRAADEAAFLRCVLPEDAPGANERRHVLSGIAPALAMFLPMLKDSGGGLPFGPTNQSWSYWIDGMLLEFGKVAELQRIAALERYGLSRCKRADDGTIRIEVESDGAEAADRDAIYWLRTETKRRIAVLQGPSSGIETIINRLNSTCDKDMGWFIRYEGHEKLIEHYRERAMTEVLAYAESEALAHDAQIGGRLFAEWRAVCVAALGRVLNHLAYATQLHRRHPDLILRNLLTVPVLRKDAAEVWIEAGDEPERVDATISHLTLDADSIAPWQKHHEIPAPFYIDVGGGWFLLPMFGGLLNPICGLVRTLRLRHGREWDAVVGHREAYFRVDIKNQFREPRFVVPNNGFVLRRTDGSHVTDADAAILDKETGSLALVQLKWPDIFGLSPSERESRRLNLLKANEWVDRAHAWIAGRSAKQVGLALGIGGGASHDRSPLLLVIPRYTARFTRNDRLDSRAGWATWPEVVRMRMEQTDIEDPLTELSQRFRAGGTLAFQSEPTEIVYKLHELDVHINLA